MTNLIAKIRLEVARKNLHQITRLSDSVNARRQYIERLSQLLSDADNLSHTIKVGLNSARELADLREENGQRKGDDDESLLVAKLKGIRGQMDKLSKSINSASGIAREMLERLVPLADNFDNLFKDDIKRQTHEWVKDLNKAEVELNKGTADPVLDEEWRRNVCKVYDTSQPIFSEYVNFLGGLALRDTGFDENVCRIADDIISTCSPLAPSHSMTIPSLKGTLTLARIIRMGFPEWTIWALPLTAHGLGQAIMSDRNIFSINQIISEEVEKLAADSAQHRDAALAGNEKEMLETRVQICMADAFAAHAVGPAYVCALILLRLNPHLPVGNDGFSPTDAERAYIALHMLDLMSGSGVQAAHYQNIIEILREEWDLSLRQAHGAEVALNPSVVESLERCAKRIFDHLEEDPRSGYKHTHWASTKKALATLIEYPDLMSYYIAGDNSSRDDPDLLSRKEQINLTALEDWRDVLNAAWGYRVERLYAGEEVDTDSIAKAAQDLWTLISRKRDDKGPSSNSPDNVGGQGPNMRGIIHGGNFS